jgi:hypothetical protein
VPRLERLEDGLDTLHVSVAVLSVDGVQPGLEDGRVGLLLVRKSVTGSRVGLEVSVVEIEVLIGELLLLLLELDEFLRVDDRASSASSSSASSSATRRERDAGALSVGGNDRVEPRLGLSLRSESLGRLHRDTEKDGGVGSRRSETPGLSDVGFGGGDVEPTRHLSSDHPRDERRRTLSDRARVAEAESRSKLVQRELLALLRRRAELELEVGENLVLEGRLSADEVFDGFGEGDLLDLLLPQPDPHTAGERDRPCESGRARVRRWIGRRARGDGRG